ncbi:ABC transporter permease subunit [Nocardioides sp. dk4132]|uniref:ABC transporter permease n=1 Tax=unclassified Nocardioides TaxID=2615069 RepID=UPI0012966F56|nr:MULTISPECIES: ABC transporter permease subunit [unclassified Nocardioides]MQW76756.1 ABC transporter permease subunit [Nocardioides sp. dk4132]QGA06889.1 ABC transporter permease subunit [Nocardioides sp. dk884]
MSWERTDTGVPRIPLGEWVESGFDWIKTHLGDFFDAVGGVIVSVTDGLADLLNTPPAVVLTVVLALLAWLVRDWKLALTSLLGLLFVAGVDQWENAMETLALVLVATLAALVVAIPTGIMAARSPRVSRVVRPVMDLMQTMPAFVWLVPVVSLFGINVSGAVVATVIFALPPGVRLTELGIRQVDPEIVEAGQAFGAAPREILRGIQLPLAMPTIMAGVNQVIMLALSMAVIAGLVGGGGLGGEVTKAINSLNIGLGFEAGLSVVVLAVFLDRLTAAFSDRAPRRLTLPLPRRAPRAAQPAAA